MFILELVSDARISLDNDAFRKILWHLKPVSAFAEGSSSIGNIATSVIANEVEKMERKNVCNDSLKRSEKVKTLPTKTSVKLSSKCEATFVSDLLFRGLVFLANSCNINFDDCKGHELWVYPPVMFESTI